MFIRRCKPALSTSSPYWQGEDTGLACYRLTVFDNLPRTGLPPRFTGWGEYQRTVQILCDLNVIEDATKIWWDLRPSDRYPTIEARVCDVSPRMEDTLTIAALIQSLARMLWRLSKKNQRWRMYDSFLIKENRWRAQRYGTTEGLIDFGRGERRDSRSPAPATRRGLMSFQPRLSPNRHTRAGAMG